MPRIMNRSPFRIWRVALRIDLPATVLLAACGTAPLTTQQPSAPVADAITLPTSAIPTIPLPPSPVVVTAELPSPSLTPAPPAVLLPLDPLPPPELPFEGARAMQYVEAQMQWVPRHTGQGIPAVDLIDFDYLHWHTVEDTTDKLSAQSREAIGRTVERWLDTRATP